MGSTTITAVTPLKQEANQGGFAGASRLSRELAMWGSPLRSADAAHLREKDTLDARALDLERNDGYINNGIQTYKDSIVGGMYRINAKPIAKMLGLDDVWAEEFQEYVELTFTAFAESPDCWIDASRHNTLTGMVRLAVALSVTVGESVSTAEWIRQVGRPYNTAIQMIDPIRLSNPEGKSDDKFLRKGVEMDRYGAPVNYWFRESVMGDPFEFDQFRWKAVKAYKPWGRKMVLHYFEQQRVAQSRGIGDLVSVLKESKMTKKYNDMVLQNAVLNASFAAALESDLPPQEAFASIGGSEGVNEWAASYLEAIAAYTGQSPNMQIDGVRIPHLYPGTKLKLQNVGQPGGVGTGFEASLLRNIAAGLGLSYEEFSRDFTKTNYSSARAAMGQTWKLMQARKKSAADAFATDVYRLWFEEAYNRGDFKSVLPRNAPNFYEGMNKDFYTNCTWIGASRGQIDELKETQAAIQRIDAGLSTYEVECARFGTDFREVFAQRQREQNRIKELGLVFNLTGSKGTTEEGGNAANESPKGTNLKNEPKPSDPGEDDASTDD
jgi:lambda family phage portal protein